MRYAMIMVPAIGLVLAACSNDADRTYGGSGYRMDTPSETGAGMSPAGDVPSGGWREGEYGSGDYRYNPGGEPDGQIGDYRKRPRW